MSNWIALFRGINVGGSNILPMKTLAATLEAEGFSDVKTYIQSGNLHAPDGMGNSKLAAAAERHLGVDAAARNWRTVLALLEMAG